MRIRDTLTRQVVELVPREAGKISMYVCGVTPYAPAHIGHARTAVVYDVLKRFLRHAGYDVMHVSNYTDVDDKIIKAAQERRVAPLELSAGFIDEYLRDMASLNVTSPDVTPRVSESIGIIIDLIRKIEANGYAYRTSDGVYFSVRKDSHYGCLSGRSVDDMRSGARVEVNEAKEDPLDFALWKLAKPGEIAWESPWGSGRPGWHIECSAMSLKYLGAGFDLHGGGEDLIFPHHENEIAQSEAALGGGGFVRYWMHSGLVNMGSEKMSKSLGNVVSVHELLEQYPGQVVRLYLLQTSYEKPLKFSMTGLGQAFSSYERMVEFESFLNQRVAVANQEAEERIKTLCRTFMSEFEASMENNLNVPRSLAAMYEFMTNVRRADMQEQFGGTALHAVKVFREALEILGLEQTAEYATRKTVLLGAKDGLLRVIAQQVGAASVTELSTCSVLNAILEKRRRAREVGDYKISDNIRERLRDIGIALEDGIDGVRYRLHG